MLCLLGVSTAHASTSIVIDNTYPSCGTRIAGNGTTATLLGQSFTATISGTLTSVTYKITSNGTPTDNLLIYFEADVAGSPSGVPLDTITKVDPADGIYTDVFAGAPSIVSGSSYWIVFTRSGAVDSSNYLVMCRNTSGVYAGGTNKDFSVTWQDQSPTDLSLTLLQDLPPSPALDTSATSTVNQTEQNVFNGFFVFLVTMWFVVWSFKKRS